MPAASAMPPSPGEIVSSRYEILPMIVEQTIDYMRCSPIHIGGITEGKKLAAIGEPYEVRTAYHGPGDVSPIGAAASAHVGMAIPNFGIQEWVRHPDPVHEVLTGGPWFDDGYLRLSDAPGLGVTPRFDVLGEPVSRDATYDQDDRQHWHACRSFGRVTLNAWGLDP